MTDQRTTNCALCMLLPFILGIAAFIALYWYVKDSNAENIQNDLSFKSNELLKERKVGGTVVNMDGRDATLTGTAVNESRSKEIERIVLAIPGIRVVDNQLKIAETKVVEVAPAPISESEIVPAPIQSTEPGVQAEAISLKK